MQINLEHVSVVLNNHKLLDDISFFIDHTQQWAITGESGSGKSTFVDLICGLIMPSEGSILLDKYKANLNNKFWKNKIGYVTQDYYISDGLLINNVAFGIDEIDINKKHAIKSLNDSKFPITSYQSIENFKLIEHGKNLSGGQRQRLGIARALFSKPQLLVLDEATSSLDSETELRISKAIQNLKGKVTVVIIAHRLSTIRNADNIFVIDKGQIAETGTHDTLIAQKGIYSNLVELQGVETSQ